MDQRRLPSGAQRRRQPGVCASEIRTIVIHFHQSGYRDCTTYYTHHVQKHLRAPFPKLVDYSRFVALLPRVLGLLWGYALMRCGRCTGVSFVDSTTLAVCHPRRIQRHKVCAGVAARGRASMGWFYGFKLHLVVSDRGEGLAFALTSGKVDDRTPGPHLARRLWGKLFGDKG